MATLFREGWQNSMGFMIVRHIFGILIFAVTLTGCSSIYPSQKVVPGTSDGTKVRIIDMTSESVMLANRSAYSPRELPEVFSQTAGLQGQMMGVGALPEPAYKKQNRPTQIETRLPSDAVPSAYRLGTGDVVLLATPSGSSVEELAGLLAAQNNRQGYTVQDDGAIAIPNVGRILISGLTIEEAESVLFQRLVEAQIEPTFSIEVSEFNSQKVSVGGAVSAPGNVSITLTPLYLDEVIAGAGGVSAPSMEYVTVRLYRDGTLYQIPLSELYSSSGMSRILMKSGDIIFVDTTYELDQAAAYFQQQVQLASFRQTSRVTALNALSTEILLRRAELDEARSNFTAVNALDAVERDYVYIAGELTKPGRFTLPFGRTANLSDALFDGAGGLKVNTSDPREIYVVRGSNDPMEFASFTAWHLNAKNVAHMVLATRFELRPNDVVFVSEKPVTRWSRALSQITPQIINLGASAVN